MRLIGLGAMVAAVVSCGGGDVDEAADNHGWGWHYDAQGETGIRLRNAQPERYSMAQYESDWVQVQSCMGIAVDEAPLVIQRQSLPLGDDFGPLDYGGTYLDTGLILHYAAEGMDTMDSKHARHEFVHYIRMRQGAADAEHRTHDHWSYRNCADFTH